ncbi:serine threonine protein kinase CMGC group [Coemansia sp. RSA 2322]|nr:serine threonine protein kinase CMGC group [Coemansia sp. RSA 2322]
MSVLSFVTSLFRSRNNRVDSQNDSSSKSHFLPAAGSPALTTTNSNHGVKQLLPLKPTRPVVPSAVAHHDQPNQLRRMFTSSKLHHRPLIPKSLETGHSNADAPTRPPQQKAEPSCDDRDGHYIVVPGRDFTQRFKIRRLLGQGTFGKVMECEDAATGRLVAIKVIRAVSKYRDAAKIEIRVLQTLQRNDPTNVFQCMHVNETFDHRNHVCMVFDLLGPSVFDFLKENEFRPFSLHHVQLFAEQLLRSVAFLHSLNLVHTDLKPENILLESGEYDVVPFGSSHTVKTRMLKSTNIRLIDFGSATFNNEYHSQVVSTRHYRAPEIILNLGWSFPCDMWSIGCIILELLTGEALFQTHDNNEHLAMMEVVVGQAPAHIVRSVAPDLRPKFFRSDGTARYPAPDQPRQSQKGLRAMRPLDQLVNPATNPIYANLHDLLYRLLQYDPRARITAKEACDHQFFRHRVGPDGRLANRPPPTPQHQQHSQAPAQQQQQQILASAADMAHYSAAHQQRLHRPSFPSASAAMPQLPAAAAVAAPSVNSYTFPSGVARAPLRVADYSISAANGTQRHSALQHHHLAPSTPKAALASQLHAAAQPSGYYYREQGNISSHLAYQQDYVNRLPPPPPPHYQQQAPPQLQLHSRAHADAYPWHYASSASMAAVHTPTLPSGAMPTGYEAHSSVDMATSQPRSSSKRKAGAPIDSGYFPDIAGSVADSLHNGHSSPVAGGPLGNGGGGVPRPLPRNYSSGSLFTTAPLPGSMASPGCYAAAGNNSKACNLPPLAPHAATQPIAVAGSGVSLPLHHQYHQQRQLLGNHPSSGAMGGASGIARVPIDANATPTLTIASTATPTPGSTSTQLGNGAAHHIEGNMAAGTHKLAGRSLPSLALGNGMARAGMMDATQQQQQHAGYYYRQNMAPQMPHRSPQPASPMAHQQQQQQALAHASRGGGYYANPPPPHTLLQPPPPQQAPSGPAHMDYAHHSHQFASPSSTQHPNYY